MHLFKPHESRSRWGVGYSLRSLTVGVGIPVPDSAIPCAEVRGVCSSKVVVTVGAQARIPNLRRENERKDRERVIGANSWLQYLRSHQRIPCIGEDVDSTFGGLVAGGLLLSLVPLQDQPKYDHLLSSPSPPSDSAPNRHVPSLPPLFGSSRHRSLLSTHRHFWPPKLSVQFSGLDPGRCGRGVHSRGGLEGEEWCGRQKRRATCCFVRLRPLYEPREVGKIAFHPPTTCSARTCSSRSPRCQYRTCCACCASRSLQVVSLHPACHRFINSSYR